MTRLTTDITNVQMAYMMTIRMLARAPIMIILSWIMTMTINVKVAHDFPGGGSGAGIRADLHRQDGPQVLCDQVFDEYDVLNNTVQENVNAARVVKAYVTGGP